MGQGKQPGVRTITSSFAEIEPAYANEFMPFTPKVMFSAIGTDVIDVRFQAAGAATPAAVSGCGVVLADVDLDDTTSIGLLDKDDRGLGRFLAPKPSDANGLPFVGARYDAAIVLKVDAAMDPLRNDPRFVALLRKLGFAG